MRALKPRSPSSSARRFASAAPRVSCHAIAGTTGRPAGIEERAGLRHARDADRGDAARLRRPAARRATRRSAAATRSSGSSSAPVSTLRQGVGARPFATSRPSVSKTAALIAVVPASRPRTSALLTTPPRRRPDRVAAHAALRRRPGARLRRSRRGRARPSRGRTGARRRRWRACRSRRCRRARRIRGRASSRSPGARRGSTDPPLVAASGPACRAARRARSASQAVRSRAPSTRSQPRFRCPSSSLSSNPSHSSSTDRSVGSWSSTSRIPAPIACGVPAGTKTASPAPTGISCIAASIASESWARIQSRTSSGGTGRENPT